MGKKNSRIPSAVGAIPIVGDLVKQADDRAHWMQEVVEQNARLVTQLPSTLKAFNDSLERFNQTIGRMDRLVTKVEKATNQLVAPLEEVAPRLEKLVALLDLPTMRDIPEVLAALRKEAVPALRAATDTQKQIALIAATLDGVIGLLDALPGAGFVRRFTGARHEEPGVRPDEPGVQPEEPTAQPEEPAAQPAKPAARRRPAKPAARPAKPAARPAKPAARPAKSAAQPEDPAAGA